VDTQVVPPEVVDTVERRVAVVECADIYRLSLCSEGEVQLGAGRRLVSEEEFRRREIYPEEAFGVIL
jgi:hypothetical protein